MRIAIIDDEVFCVGTIEGMLQELFEDIDIVGTAFSVKEGIELINEQKPELVFLDIQLKGGDAFDILEQVIFNDFQIIFTTAFNDYAIKAFEFSTVHYLLKPIDEELLEQAVRKYQQQKEPQHQQYQNLQASWHQGKINKIAVPTQDSILFISLDTIIRCEADSSYTMFYTNDDKRVLVTKSLKSYETLLQQEGFFRVHDKHLINLKYVARYIRGRGGQVELQDGTAVDVSKRRKKEFLNYLQQYFKM